MVAQAVSQHRLEGTILLAPRDELHEYRWSVQAQSLQYFDVLMWLITAVFHSLYNCALHIYPYMPLTQYYKTEAGRGILNINECYDYAPNEVLWPNIAL